MTEQIVNQKKIQESEGLKPIVLTSFGETLQKYPQSQQTEESKLDLVPGVHAVCKGWIDKKKVSSEYFALVCRNCGLRIVIPKIITTFAQLRSYCGRQRAMGLARGL